MDGQTVVVTGNRAACVTVDNQRTFYLRDVLGWLGDPVDTVRIPGRAASPAPPTASEDEAYQPRTELGRRLWEIRKRIVAAGMATMTWDDIERELAERRGETGDRDL